MTLQSPLGTCQWKVSHPGVQGVTAVPVPGGALSLSRPASLQRAQGRARPAGPSQALTCSVVWRGHASPGPCSPIVCPGAAAEEPAAAAWPVPSGKEPCLPSGRSGEEGGRAGAARAGCGCVVPGCPGAQRGHSEPAARPESRQQRQRRSNGPPAPPPGPPPTDGALAQPRSG